MDVRVREFAARQSDIVAAWQLLASGWTRRMVVHRVREHGWRVIHPGVYALTYAPLTRQQRWIAATLTAPHTVLSHASAAACWGFRAFNGSIVMVTRPGTGGKRGADGLLVFRSSTLRGDTTRHNGIAITTATRTLLDLTPALNQRETRRAFRELRRLKLATADELDATLERHRGRRGTHFLRQIAHRYHSLPYERTRSNPEAFALEVLYDAGVPMPLVNAPIAGEEADLTWLERKLIIEIDGPQYHQFREEDARKQAIWEKAGFTVRRISSDAIYANPAALLVLLR